MCSVVQCRYIIARFIPGTAPQAGPALPALPHQLPSRHQLSLDCAVAEFLTPDQLVISLKGGELYVLSLRVDSLRAVKGFHLDKAAASVLTTSISLAGLGYLFLGSRLGNSLLLKFTSRELGQVGGRLERESPSERKRLDMQGDWLDTELDEFEVYGSQETAAHRITAYSFEVCDSLLNIGPCGQVAMGEPAFLSEELAASSPDPDIELVTTSGTRGLEEMEMFNRRAAGAPITANEVLDNYRAADATVTLDEVLDSGTDG